jgi:hypothetical protein
MKKRLTFATSNLNKIKMKNLLTAAIAVFTIGASAQDVNFKSKRGENFLPEKGDWALGFSTDGIFEYLGNSFNGDTNNNAPTLGYTNGFDGQFVGKYFNKDKSAYRVIFNFRTEGTGNKKSTNSDDNTFVENPTNPAPNVKFTDILKEENTTSSTEFSIGLGKEWRRGKTRLQGFYGADVLLFFTSGKQTSYIYDEFRKVTITPAQIEKDIVQTDVNTKFGSGFGVGAQGFIGAEYFLFPKIAIGAQYNYGLRFISAGEGKTTTVVTNIDEDSLDTPVLESDVTTTVTRTPSTYTRGLNGVGIASINLTLHF